MRRYLTRGIIAGAILSITLPVFAESPWLIRLRGIGVLPDPSSSTISIIGGKVTKISSPVVPELDFSYFFLPHVAAELILATSRHSVTATDTILGSVNLGGVSVLPPTLTAQYHFDLGEQLKPYVGVGINYTYFYNVYNGPVATNIKYGSSVGPAVQFGTDIKFDGNFLLNIDVKKIWIGSNVTVSTAITPPLHTSVDINPWVLGLGLGYRFS